MTIFACGWNKPITNFVRNINLSVVPSNCLYVCFVFRMSRILLQGANLCHLSQDMIDLTRLLNLFRNNKSVINKDNLLDYLQSYSLLNLARDELIFTHKFCVRVIKEYLEMLTAEDIAEESYKYVCVVTNCDYLIAILRSYHDHSNCNICL